ncbi:hypothetical protein QE363_000141 [Sphingomonas sp. SORGH_AS870]|nr:hypothetical protein [Sphingomonas sp. SORGH_AS_0870]
MPGGDGQACPVRDAPGDDLDGVRLARSPEALLAAVRTAGGGERLPGVIPPGLGALADGLTLHLRDLCQHRDDQPTCARADQAESTDDNLDAPVVERPHRRVDVDGIAAQPIDGGDMQPVALADVSEHCSEAGSIPGQHRAADALIEEFLVEGLDRRSEQRATLRLDRLTAGRHTVIGNLTHSFSSWGESYPSTSEPSSIAFLLSFKPALTPAETLARKLELSHGGGPGKRKIRMVATRERPDR